MLRRLLQKGPVKVRAIVHTRYYDGKYPYVTGVIPGNGESREEVLTLGHIAEQGAQDNTTGVAAIIEGMAALHRLIESGKLPRPKRTIRMLAMGELYSSLHYIANNKERISRTIGAFCLDTPAGFYDLAGTEYTFYLNPHSAKSYTDSLILEDRRSVFSAAESETTLVLGRVQHRHRQLPGRADDQCPHGVALRRQRHRNASQQRGHAR